ncbi:MAG: 4-oxalocrotonate tautomerase [Stutzerimonas stutzeri]|nr:MAG: 4-oxalocrotonate tautomerase [Stutzerimonas stutzeri]
MPHVVVKALAGRTEEQKTRLAEAITREVMAVLECGSDAVSVGFEDIAPNRWKDDVYLPDIQGRADTIYKQPGYQV